MLRKHFSPRRFFVRRERIVYFIRKVFVLMVGELGQPLFSGGTQAHRGRSRGDG
jgi:hypothetical protein